MLHINFNYILLLINLGCSKDTQPISSEETPTAENISSISDTIESVIYAGCSKSSNLLCQYIQSMHNIQIK